MSFQIPAGAYVKGTFFSTLGDQVANNVLWWQMRFTGAPSVDALAAVTAYWTGVVGLYAACLDANAVANGMKLEWFGATPRPEPVYYRQDVNGTVVGDPLPRQCSGIIGWRSGLIGASRRGRSYIPFAAEADNVPAAHPSVGYLNNLDTLATFLRNNIVPVGGVPVTWALQVYSTTLDDFFEVESYVLPDKWATQRRRGDFGRTNVLPF